MTGTHHSAPRNARIVRRDPPSPALALDCSAQPSHAQVQQGRLRGGGRQVSREELRHHATGVCAVSLPCPHLPLPTCDTVPSHISRPRLRTSRPHARAHGRPQTPSHPHPHTRDPAPNPHAAPHPVITLTWRSRRCTRSSSTSARRCPTVCARSTTHHPPPTTTH